MRGHEAIQTGKLRLWKRLLFRGMIQDTALETLITDISLGSLFKIVDIAPYNSRGTRYAKELFHCRITFYLEFYQNECQLDQFRRNKNSFLLKDANKIEPQL